MTAWAVFAVAAALAAAALARPLLGRPSERAADAGRADFDMQVFRRQLADLEADRARGLVATGEAEAARLEIERRILAAAAETEREGAAGARGAGGRRRAGALALAAAIGAGVPALSLALYAAVGAPGEPDRPLAERPQQPPPAMGAEGMPADVEAAMRNACAKRRTISTAGCCWRGPTRRPGASTERRRRSRTRPRWRPATPTSRRLTARPCSTRPGAL